MVEMVKVKELGSRLYERHDKLNTNRFRREMSGLSAVLTGIRVAVRVSTVRAIHRLYPALLLGWTHRGDKNVGRLYDEEGVPLDGNITSREANIDAMHESVLTRAHPYCAFTRGDEDVEILPRVYRGGSRYTYLPKMRNTWEALAFVDLLSEKLSRYWKGGALEYAWAHPDNAGWGIDRRCLNGDALFPYRVSSLEEAARQLADDLAMQYVWKEAPRFTEEQLIIEKIEKGTLKLVWGHLGKLKTKKSKDRTTKTLTEMMAQLEGELHMLKDVNPSDLDPNANEQGGDEHTEVLVPKKDTKTEAPKPPAAPEKIEPMKGLFV